MIEFLHISKSFQGKEILHDVSLSVEERQTVCIIGESGCGKTTLLRCMAGLDNDNHHSSDRSQKLKVRVGMVFHVRAYSCLEYEEGRSGASCDGIS